MTIAISINVNDGIVLAADSAGTLSTQTTNNAPPTIVQVYNNANKIVNLCKGLPIGAIFWGNGAIGKASISTLLKDLRDRFSGKVTAPADWTLDRRTYTVADVAAKVKTYLIDDQYTPTFASWPQKPMMGLIVAGYSASGGDAEEYKIEVDAQGNCTGPTPVRSNHGWGAIWAGEPEAVTRLLNGYSPVLSKAIEGAIGVPAARIDVALQQSATLPAQIISPAMPIQDAIDVAEFLVELTSKYSRYTPGAATVGGPVEVAAITKHEGFRWVKRKYYFSADLNPEPRT